MWPFRHVIDRNLKVYLVPVYAANPAIPFATCGVLYCMFCKCELGIMPDAVPVQYSSVLQAHVYVQSLLSFKGAIV